MVLRRDEIERRDGSRGSYAVVDKPDFAVVIPSDGNRFCLVEEYRYPVGRRCWAFPQGAFPGRVTGDPEQLARLELVQETGLSARRLTPLGFLNSAHGLSSQGFHAFLATGLTAGTPQREAEEQGDLRVRVGRTAKDVCGEDAVRFDELRIVEQLEGLQRCVRAQTADARVSRAAPRPPQH